MKVILPLFAFLGRESPRDTAKGISLGKHDEGKEAILLLHSLMYGAGGLRLRKELYEMRGAAVIASLMTGYSSLENIDSDFGFYFVHSFYFECKNHENILSTSNYGCEFTSSIYDNHIIGTQFHPEKSHGNGVQLLKNFSEL